MWDRWQHQPHLLPQIRHRTSSKLSFSSPTLCLWSMSPAQTAPKKTSLTGILYLITALECDSMWAEVGIYQTACVQQQNPRLLGSMSGATEGAAQQPHLHLSQFSLQLTHCQASALKLLPTAGGFQSVAAPCHCMQCVLTGASEWCNGQCQMLRTVDCPKS